MKHPMKIIVDGFGGDHAPLEILKGCAEAVKAYNTEILMTGREAELRQVASSHGIVLDGITILHAPDVIGMEDDPNRIRKDLSNCSMAEGLRRLAAGEGDAFVSAGSTGALVMGSTFIVKRMKGVKRCSIATVMPSNAGPYLLLDSGANAEVRPEMLRQFAIMGSVYMEKVMHIPAPRVALINNGTEEKKGGELQQQAYQLLKSCGVNFTGNIEGRDLPYGGCDVAVTDGFTGNIVLKLTEGMAGAMLANIKEILMKNTLTKLSAAMLKSGFGEFRKKMDYSEYGGAPLLGLQKPVLKAHGASSANAIKNAVRKALEFAQANAVSTIAAQILPYSDAGENPANDSLAEQ